MDCYNNLACFALARNGLTAEWTVPPLQQWRSLRRGEIDRTRQSCQQSKYISKVRMPPGKTVFLWVAHFFISGDGLWRVTITPRDIDTNQIANHARQTSQYWHHCSRGRRQN